MKDSEEILEEWLVVNSQQGDKKALELLIKRWHPKLIRRIYHTTRDAVASQDIAQDVWVIIIKKLRSLKDPKSFKWWSLRIATTKAIDWIRANQLDRKRDEIRKMVQDEYESSSTRDEKEEAIASLRLAIQELSEAHSQIVRMFYQEKLGVAIIAQVLEIPVGTVKTRLFKARKKLKETLENKMMKS